MERFVTLIVAGGVALVAGLWLLTAFAAPSPGWGVAVVFVLAGIGGLAEGIREELEH